MAAAVYDAQELAALTKASSWLVYKTVKDGTCPFPFIRLGKRIVFPKALVDKMLGVADSQESA